MGLAERLAAHQNKEEEDDRPLTEDEELAKRTKHSRWQLLKFARQVKPSFDKPETKAPEKAAHAAAASAARSCGCGAAART